MEQVCIHGTSLYTWNNLAPTT